MKKMTTLGRNLQKSSSGALDQNLRRRFYSISTYFNLCKELRTTNGAIKKNEILEENLLSEILKKKETKQYQTFSLLSPIQFSNPGNQDIINLLRLVLGKTKLSKHHFTKKDLDKCYEDAQILQKERKLELEEYLKNNKISEVSLDEFTLPEIDIGCLMDFDSVFKSMLGVAITEKRLHYLKVFLSQHKTLTPEEWEFFKAVNLVSNHNSRKIIQSAWRSKDLKN